MLIFGFFKIQSNLVFKILKKVNEQSKDSSHKRSFKMQTKQELNPNRFTPCQRFNGRKFLQSFQLVFLFHKIRFILLPRRKLHAVDLWVMLFKLGIKISQLQILLHVKLHIKERVGGNQFHFSFPYGISTCPTLCGRTMLKSFSL